MAGQNSGQSLQRASRAAIPAPRIPNVPHVEQSCKGLDLSHDPSRVFPGFATRLDNLRLRFGRPVTRPGFQGQLAAKHGAALYGLTEYRNSDQTTSLIYDTGGRIYELMAGASSDAEITVPGSGTLNSPGAQYAQLGKYKYRVDGVAPLLRIDPTGGTSKLALSTPATPPTASLISTLLDDWGTGTFTADSLTTAPGVNRATNPNFYGGSNPDDAGHNRTMPGWDTLGSPMDWYTNPKGVSGVFALLDTPGTGFGSTAAMVNDTQSLDTSRRATTFYAAYDYFTSDTQGRGSLITTLTAYATTDGTGAEVATISYEDPALNNGLQTRTVSHVFEFGDLTSPVGSFRLRVIAGVANVQGPDNAPYLTNIVAYPYVPPVTVADSGHALTLTQSVVPNLPSYQSGTLLFNGLHLRRSYGTPKDLSGAYNADIPLGTGYPPALLFKMRLHASGSISGTAAGWWDTNAAHIDTATGNASVDISTVPSGVLQSVDMIELVFLSDAVSPLPSITLGPLRSAGDLSVPNAALGTSYAPYSWAYTEVDSAGDTTLFNVIESNPSGPSASLTATAEVATGQIVLPAPTNGTTTHYRVYRAGGVFSDGLYRLVATVSTTANTITDQDGSLVSWNYAARTLIDDTPDAWLELTSATVADFGRDAPPAGASAVCAWQGRIWLAVGGRLYGSWLVQSDAQAALYFNQILDPTDPNAAIKGDNFAVGLADNDPIQALVPIGTNAFFGKGYLVVLKRNSVYLVSGTDPSNFAIQSYLIGSGIGCAAPRAAGLVGNRVWFLGYDGVYEFDADVADPKSVVIERGLLPPTLAGGGAPAAWALSSLAYHDRRCHVCVPTPGDSAPTVKYVWDSREEQPGGWTRDTGAAFTGGVSLSGGSASGVLYWAGQDGQVYAEAGALDKSLSASAGTGIAYAYQTRALGQESDGLDYWRERQASWWQADVRTTQAGGQVTCGLVGEGVSWTEQHYLNAAGGLTHVRKDVPSYVKGRSLEATLSGTATAEQEFQAVGAILEAGGLR